MCLSELDVVSLEKFPCALWREESVDGQRQVATRQEAELLWPRVISASNLDMECEGYKSGSLKLARNQCGSLIDPIRSNFRGTGKIAESDCAGRRSERSQG